MMSSVKKLAGGLGNARNGNVVLQKKTSVGHSKETLYKRMKKYGKDNVSQLITFGSMSAKAVVRDVGRVFNMPYGDVDKIAKLIPNRLNIKLKEAIEEEPKLKELQTKNEQVKDMLVTEMPAESTAELDEARRRDCKPVDREESAVSV